MKTRSNKRILSLLMALVMVLSLVPATAVTAFAQDAIYYTDADGSVKTVSSYTVVSAENDSWSGGWYVVNTSISGAFNVSGDVHLILCDGCTLTAEGAGVPGIGVNSGNCLTVYAGNTTSSIVGTGTLNATGSEFCAGIGSESGEEAGTITVNGGIVSANGGENGAGIGGGDNGLGGTVTVNGGTVTANGGTLGAGIGGGKCNDGGTVTVNGGTVIATGGDQGAGIGGGKDEDGGTVNITGGTVIANGGNQGAGIGGGKDGRGGTVTVNGGSVTATGAAAAGIGRGYEGGAYGYLYVADGITVKAGDSANPTAVFSHTNIETDIGYKLDGKPYVTITAPDPVNYLDASGNLATCTDYTVVDVNTTTLGSGWYVVNSTVTTTGTVTVSDDCTANLILCDGCTLTVTGSEDYPGIHVSGSNSLTVYAGNTTSAIAGTGAINATAGSGSSNSGIGGTSNDESCGTITINGGNVTASGGSKSAGIGGSDSGTIVINGGNVTATGGTDCAGIGNNCGGANTYSITINGGNVTAIGGSAEYEHGAAGIGSGVSCTTESCTITINGGNVTATGSVGQFGTGSGIGYAGDPCGSVKVYVADGLTVKAGGSANPTAELSHASITTDIGSVLKGKPYVTITASEQESATPEECLTFTGTDAFKVKLKMNSTPSSTPDAVNLEYKTGDAEWQTLTVNTDISVPKDTSIHLRAGGTTGKNATFSKDAKGYYQFVFTVESGVTVAASGNVMSLLDATCQATEVPTYAFNSLFKKCTALTSAPRLPATKLNSYCYQNMFNGCTALASFPQLKATALADNCYVNMFNGCSNLLVTAADSAETADWIIPYTAGCKVATGQFATSPVYNMAANCANGGATVEYPAASNTNYYNVQTPPDPVNYLDASGNLATCTDYTVVDNTTTLGNGWYVVNSTVNTTGTVTVSDGCTANLILCDGAQWKNVHEAASATSAVYGMKVEGNLNIYGQSAGTGKLTADSTNTGTRGAYGIYVTSGSSATLYGGTVVTKGTASNSTGGIVNYGTLAIKGGTVTATGVSSDRKGCGISSLTSFTISGGTVTATGTSTSDVGYGIDCDITTVTVTGKNTSVTVTGSTQAICSPLTATGMTIKAGADAGDAKVVSSYSYQKYVSITAHTHSWSYKASGTDIIVATCSAADCPNNVATATTLVAPTAPVEDGQAKPATLTSSVVGAASGTDLTITYAKKNGSNWDTCSAAPTAAGTYKAEVTFGGATAMVEYTIKTAPAEAPSGASKPSVTTSGTNKLTSSTLSIGVKKGMEYFISTSSTAPTDWSGDGYYKPTADGTKTFSDLDAATKYYIHYRTAETDTAAASKSGSINQFTLPETPEASVVTINYATEKLSFGDTYEVSTKADFSTTVSTSTDLVAGTTYYVRVKAVADGAPASEAASFTTPARPAAPTAVTAAKMTRTDTTLTVADCVATQEYSVDGTTWKSPVDGKVSFTGLTAGTAYTLRTRTKAITTKGSEKLAGTAATTAFTTKTAPAEAPSGSNKPSVTTSGTNKLTSSTLSIGVKKGMEYFISTSSTAPADWSGDGYYKPTADGTKTFSDLDAATRYYIHYRTAETDTAAASKSGSINQFTLPETPEASVVTINYATEKLSFGDTYEVSTKADFSTTVSTSTDLVAGTTYYVRVKAVTDGAPASEAASFTTPARPAALSTASDLTVTVESVMNKKDGKLAGVTSAMEYKLGDGSWTTGNGEVIENPDNKTIVVRVKAVTTAGSEAFAGEELTITFPASDTKLIVSLVSEPEASAAEYAKVAYGDTLEKPATPDTKKTKNYTFGGWYADEDYTNAWNFDVDTVVEDLTLYAKWIKNATEKAAISGTVTGLLSGEVTTVELWLGDEKIAATTTDENGAYSFDYAEAGTYNIVVTQGSKTSTTLLTVDKAGDFTAEPIEMPSLNVSSVIELTGEEIAGAKADVSRITVGGLDEIADTMHPDPEDSVTVKLTAEPVAADENSQEQAAITALTKKKTVEFVELTLTEQFNNSTPTDISDTDPILMTIQLPFEMKGVNRNSITVYSYHDGTARTFQRISNANKKADGTFIIGDGIITIYASRFSTYAVGYSKSTGGTGSASAVVVSSDMPMVRKGSSSDAVKTLQSKLNALGYSCGTADGVFGSQTYNAVVSYQKAMGLMADGIVGSQTWSKLGVIDSLPASTAATVYATTSELTGETVLLRKGSRGDSVKTLQSKLNALGYSCGTVDGIFGSQTYNAVVSYQKAMGLTVDGIVGSQTWSKLG